MVSKDQRYINAIKEEKQSLELPQEVIEKLVCRQLFHLDNSETLNLIRNFFKLKYYTNEDLKILHTIGLNYWKQYNKPPTDATIQAVLKNEKFADKSEKLLKLKNDIDSLTDFDSKYVQDTILNFIKGRSVYYTILENVDNILTTNDVSRIMPQLEDTMKISISDDVGIEYFENLNNHIVEMTTKEVRTPFNWKTWDMYTYGGIPENDGCLFVIMAQPGLGKSQMMMNIGYNWLLQDKKVLMVSLEMSEKMYSARMDALFADIGVNEIKDNTDALAKRVKLMKSTHSNARLQIKQYSPNEFNSNKLKNLLEKLEKTKGFVPDLIIVDYLNIMGTNGPSYGMKTYERVGMITKQLRAVSVERKIPILSATQSNRCVLNTSLVTVYRNNEEVIIPIKDVKIGDMIKVGDDKFNNILDKFEQEQETYQITLKSGKKIICSANHIFPTSNGEISIETGLTEGIKLHSINKNKFLEFIKKIINNIKCKN